MAARNFWNVTVLARRFCVPEQLQCSCASMELVRRSSTARRKKLEKEKATDSLADQSESVTAKSSVIDIYDPAHHERVSHLSTIFPKKDIAKLAAECPQVFYQDFSEVENIVQYIAVRMGLEQDEMVRAKVFDYPLEHVIKRHLFLERCGVYRKVQGKRKESMKLVNPPLKAIINTSDTAFTRLSQVTPEEYEVFCDMFAAQRHKLVDYIVEGTIGPWMEDELEDHLLDVEEEKDDDEDEVERKPREENRRKKR